MNQRIVAKTSQRLSSVWSIGDIIYDEDEKAYYLGDSVTLGGVPVHGGLKLKINAQAGTAYTLALADSGKLVTLANGSAITLTVPPNADVAFPLGTEIGIAQLGAGTVTLSPGAGVTLNSLGGALDLSGQYAGAVLTKLETNSWIVVGALA